MSEQPPVDAGGTQPSEAAPETTAPTQGVDYWKTEAHQAFAKRDEARAKYKELEAKYNQLSASKADASDAVTARLSELTAERDTLQTKLSEVKATHRESMILNKLTSGVPEASRQAIETIYRTHAPQLDDGEADLATVADRADAFLRQFAPTLFQNPVTPERGRLPNDGGSPEFNAERERQKQMAELRKINPAATGLSL